ncbi:MAG: adenosine deaminase [bacterium]
MQFERYPKVELHVHLDCSLSYEVVSRLRPSISCEEYERTFIGPPKAENLAAMLKSIASSLAIMQTEQQLHLVTHDLFQQFQRDGVIYAEIRFAPLLHIEQGLTPGKVVEIVESSVSEESAKTGIEARIILCALRHFTQAQSLQTAQLIEQFKGSRVAALDLAADEAGYPLEAHVAAFDYAFEQNIPRTAHAGEAKGPESIWETLKLLKPSRIGHGVRSIEDTKLIEHLKENDIHLEVSPSCNVRINLFETYSDHPVDRLLKAGVSVGINTDGRTLANISLTQEYQRLQQHFGWGKEQFLLCNLNASEGAFLPDEDKLKLKRQLLDAYNKNTI